MRKIWYSRSYRSYKRIPLAAKHKLVFGADYKVIRNLNVFGDIKYFSDMLDNGYEKINSKTIVDIGAKYW